MKKLYVVRHAEATHNLNDSTNDISSPVSTLTATGVGQAKKLAQDLAEKHIDVIYTSELQRTIDTATIINELHLVPVIVDERLNDIRTGMQGQPFAVFREALINEPDKWNKRFNDGESFEDEKYRTKNFLDTIKSNDYERILIVTHGGIANIIYGLLHDLDNETMFNRPIKNAALFEYTLE